MSISQSFLGTLKNFTRPSAYTKLFQDATSEAYAPIKSLMNTSITGDPLGALKHLGSSALRTAIPAYFTYQALKPDRSDMDTAGPFEEIGGRGSDLAYALASASPSLWAGKSLIGNIAGEIAGLTGLKLLGTHGGKMVDTLTNNRPDPNEVYDKFSMRVKKKAMELQEQYPDAAPEEVQKAAISQLLEEASGYLDYLK